METEFGANNFKCCEGGLFTKEMELFPFREVLWQGERANEYHPAPEARGYCPLHIMDLLKDGRYRVLHKIWGGGNSTFWAARDLREGKYVALKIGVTGGEKPSRELEVLQKISASQSEHPGSRNLVRLYDNFVIERPYGSHECLVLDLLGGNPQFTEGRRLPANVAKRMAKEVLLGLDCLHTQGITHGDLHAGNLSCFMPPLEHLDEHEFCEKFGEINTYNMERKDGKPIGPGVPRYLVLPGAFPKFCLPVSNDINVKIVDFGESFLKGKAPETVDTTQCLKPPEVMFGDPPDHRLDMWSMGCLLFELVVSHWPFFTECRCPITPEEYSEDVLDHLVPQEIPERWRGQLGGLERAAESSGELDVRDSLKQLYFNCPFDFEGAERFSRKDITKVGELVSRMLRLEPAERTTAAEILEDPWWDDV